MPAGGLFFIRSGRCDGPPTRPSLRTNDSRGRERPAGLLVSSNIPERVRIERARASL